MATYKTDAFQDTSKIKPRLLNSLLTAGHLRCAVCKVTMSAAGASGDVVEICNLPPESRVVLGKPPVVRCRGGVLDAP